MNILKSVWETRLGQGKREVIVKVWWCEVLPKNMTESPGFSQGEILKLLTMKSQNIDVLVQKW